jgi:hypothetical protein
MDQETPLSPVMSSKSCVEYEDVGISMNYIGRRVFEDNTPAYE